MLKANEGSLLVCANALMLIRAELELSARAWPCLSWGKTPVARECCPVNALLARCAWLIQAIFVFGSSLAASLLGGADMNRFSGSPALCLNGKLSARMQWR